MYVFKRFHETTLWKLSMRRHLGAAAAASHDNVVVSARALTRAFNSSAVAGGGAGL